MKATIGRRAIAALAMSVFSTFGIGPAVAENRIIPLSEISAYFNGIVKSSTTFTQVNEDHTLSTGLLSIMRPGRLRFDYAPPGSALVIASGGQVAIFDDAANASSPQTYPLRQTPLSILLEKVVDLEAKDMVVAHVRDEFKTIVTAQDPKHAEYGSIDLVFTDSPVQLRQWIINGTDGEKTTVILADLSEDGGINTGMFNVSREVLKRNRAK